MGTGNGRLVKIIKEKIPDLNAVVIDFSPHMIKEFKKEGDQEKNIKIIDHDLSYPLPSNLKKFDAIVSSFAIHHLTHKRKRDLYYEIFSLIKKGGVFCNLDHVVSNSLLLNKYFRDKMEQNVVNTEHNRRLAKTELQLKWFSKVGFTDVDCYWKWLEFALIVGWK
ncbi:MAG: class I SAM-dependent methyltransferase [Nitrososphaeraceae archaeon]